MCISFCQSCVNQNVVAPFLQNKEFVCRGYDYERLEDFQQRMLGEFPQAIAMQHPNQPDDTILQSDAQCILLKFMVTVNEYAVYIFLLRVSVGCSSTTAYTERSLCVMRL